MEETKLLILKDIMGTEGMEEPEKHFDDSFKYRLLKFLESYKFSTKHLEALEQTLTVLLDRKLANFKKELDLAQDLCLQKSEATHSERLKGQGTRLGETETKVAILTSKLENSTEKQKTELQTETNKLKTEVLNEITKLKSDLLAEIQKVTYQSSIENTEFKSKFKFITAIANFIIPALIAVVVGIIIHLATKGK